jgi:hypothetical protein
MEVGGEAGFRRKGGHNLNSGRELSGKRGILGPVLFVGIVGILTLFNLHRLPGWMAGQDASQPIFPAPHYTAKASSHRDFATLRFLLRVKANFAGWTLVGFDPASVAFEPTWGLPYIGLARTRVFGYRPDLSRDEYAELAPRVSDRAFPYERPAVGFVRPPDRPKNRIVIALRAPAGAEILLVPIDTAPDRIAEVVRGK